jgi:hypothetical protein
MLFCLVGPWYVRWCTQETNIGSLSINGSFKSLITWLADLGPKVAPRNSNFEPEEGDHGMSEMQRLDAVGAIVRFLFSVLCLEMHQLWCPDRQDNSE